MMMVVDYLEQVRVRAYYLWCERERDGTPGTAEEDWLLAEAEVMAALMEDRSA